MIDALPPPAIVAHLTAPKSRCVIGLEHTDAETGDITRARCGKRQYVVAHGYHGDGVSRISRCKVMLMIEGVRFPRLFHVDNCRGPLKVRDIGDVWTREILASASIAPSRLDRVIYYPIAHRPACYRIVIAFTLPEAQRHVPLGERSAMRCDSMGLRGE